MRVRGCSALIDHRQAIVEDVWHQWMATTLDPQRRHRLVNSEAIPWGPYTPPTLAVVMPVVAFEAGGDNGP
jgi:hypothetical protein